MLQMSREDIWYIIKWYESEPDGESIYLYILYYFLSISGKTFS
jgi:hypothetical protein